MQPPPTPSCNSRGTRPGGLRRELLSCVLRTAFPQYTCPRQQRQEHLKRSARCPLCLPPRFPYIEIGGFLVRSFEGDISTLFSYHIFPSWLYTDRISSSISSCFEALPSTAGSAVFRLSLLIAPKSCWSCGWMDDET